MRLLKIKLSLYVKAFKNVYHIVYRLNC